MFTREHVMGFIAGLATAGVGFYMYKKHEAEVDAFLAGKGITLPGATRTNEGASIEELVSQKERLEDLIAEREAAAVSQ